MPEPLEEIGRPIDGLQLPIHFLPALLAETVQPLEPLDYRRPKVERPLNLDEIAFWGAAAISELISSGQVTAVEVTNVFLKRLRTFGDDTKLNCVVSILEKRAISKAIKVDKEILEGKLLGPLHGVPWGIKALFAVEGEDWSCGSEALTSRRANHDAAVVKMLDEAGAILVALLATTELGGAGDHWWRGQVKNPWKLDQGSGGSSSGPASAVSAGLVCFAIGSETNGSILYPSSTCGVVGLRPTYGRINKAGLAEIAWSSDRPGPIARSPEDCALVLAETSRRSSSEIPYFSPPPFNWHIAKSRPPARVGYLENVFACSRDIDVNKAHEKIFEWLSSVGIDLVPVKIPNIDPITNLFNAECAASMKGLLPNLQKIKNPQRSFAISSGSKIAAGEYFQAQQDRLTIMKIMHETTAGIDVYIAPDANPINLPDLRDGADVLRHFMLANLSGFPAITLPIGIDANGLPINCSIFARPYNEQKLIEIADILQQLIAAQDVFSAPPRGILNFEC